MENNKHKEKVDVFFFNFLMECSALVTGISRTAIMKEDRHMLPLIARGLVMHHLRSYTYVNARGNEVEKFSYRAIAEMFDKTHATAMNAVRVINDLVETGDPNVCIWKDDFDRLTKKYNNMNQLIEEARRRQQIKDDEAKVLIERNKVVDEYRRQYNKVVAKLIRTNERPPSQRDFDLLDHIMNY